MSIESAEDALDEFETIHGVLAAPPCTHFSASGAQYWQQKDEDGRTAEALEFVDQVMRIADLFMPTDPDYYELGEPFFWALENPVGRLHKLRPELGKPFYFDPCDYAGYLDLSRDELQRLDELRRKDPAEITTAEAMFVMDCNAYTKRTCIYGAFNRHIPKRRIEPVKVCPSGSPLMKLGGGSKNTAEIRSITPAGFATAFFQANRRYQAPIWGEQPDLFDQ